MTIASLPALNAALNATSAACLLAGFLCIRAKRPPSPDDPSLGGEKGSEEGAAAEPWRSRAASERFRLTDTQGGTMSVPVRLHALCMIGAFAVSTLFLVSYLIYHARVGSVRFLGTGWIRPVYFTLLLTHTVLAMAIVPLAVRTLFLAGRRRFVEHRRIARWTFPLWLYVSVTGVIIYWMLYRMPEASACPGCKEALFDPGQLPQKLATAKGYALSIGLMLGMPAALIGGIAWLIARGARPPRNAASSSGLIPVRAAGAAGREAHT